MMQRIIDHLMRTCVGRAAVPLLLVGAGFATASAQDDILPDLEIVGASFNSPVDPGGSVTVDVTVRNSGNSMAPGSETSESSYMIDFVLSTDTHVPADWAVFSANFEEDVLLAGGRISNTDDLFPGGDDVTYTSNRLPASRHPCRSIPAVLRHRSGQRRGGDRRNEQCLLSVLDRR